MMSLAMEDRLTMDGREPALDTVAAVLSSLCLVHCLALPLLLVFMPMAVQAAAFAGPGWLHGPHWLHWALIAIALPVSARALWQGFRAHGSGWPCWLAAGGFLAMAAGALVHGLEPLEQMLTVGGGVLVALAHWRNWRARGA